ncbi:flagellar FliJ family protein [bacterium]|nr:flagellar FliJ family protein [bacterium]
MNYRENQREEQRLKVQKAQSAVNKAEADIRKNKKDIEDTKNGMRSADPQMYEFYDNFLKHLWKEAERLETVRQELQKQLDIEVEKLVKCEQAVKVLEKHKEKNRDAYLEEEKHEEQKQFSEIGVTRFYRQKTEKLEQEK